jgi:hypothetical protein
MRVLREDERLRREPSKRAWDGHDDLRLKPALKVPRSTVRVGKHDLTLIVDASHRRHPPEVIVNVA